MKKIIVLALSVVLALAVCSCGDSGSSDDKSAKEPEKEVVKIDKTIDATATELGFTGGEETLYEMIGATAGKEYNDGAVELYQFEEGTDAYKAAKEGEVEGVKISAFNDGIGLVFSNEEDANIINAFKEIKYK